MIQLHSLYLIFFLLPLSSYGFTPRPFLTPERRETLRFQLESAKNDSELQLKNHKANEAELKRLEKLMETLKINERIPADDQKGELLAQLKTGAQVHAVAVKSIHWKQFQSKLSTPPSKYSFPSEREIAQRLEFTLKVQARKPELMRWIHSWPDQQLRWIEFHSLKQLSSSVNSPITWEVQAHTYRFKALDLKLTRSLPPRQLLSAGVKNHPEEFKRREPQLWALLEKAELAHIQAQPENELKRHLLTRSLQVQFFLSKTLSAQPKSLAGRP